MYAELDIEQAKTAIAELKKYTDKKDKEGLKIIKNAEKVLTSYIIFKESKDKIPKNTREKLMLDLQKSVIELSTRMDLIKSELTNPKDNGMMKDMNKLFKVSIMGVDKKCIIKDIKVINDSFAVVTFGVWTDKIMDSDKKDKDYNKMIVPNIVELSFSIFGDKYKELAKLIKKHNL